MSSKGWIKLHRSLLDSDIWQLDNQPFDMRSAWIDLLMLANHEDKDLIFDYKPVTVKRGQFITSVRKLGTRWSWSKNRTLKYLRMLESLNMITRESDNQRTLVTIVKYEVYQDCRDTNMDTGVDANIDTVVDTGMDTGMPQTKNEKNDKNEKKNIYGEYKHVRLTQEQFNKLVSDYGEEKALDAIKFLDEYIEMKGYKAKNHNLAIRKWVFDAVEEAKKKGKFKKGGGEVEQSGNSFTGNAERDAEIDEIIRHIDDDEESLFTNLRKVQ